ncbi:hypothetical protein BC938DRAFT_478207, partial [Jimgerdemannia flammicorona]
HLVEGAELIQYREKDQESATNQHWGLTVDGQIFTKTVEHLVLGVADAASARADGSQVRLYEKQHGEYKVQHWSFLIPVFGKKKGAVEGQKTTETTTTTTTVTDTVEDDGHELLETTAAVTVAAASIAAVIAGNATHGEHEHEEHEEADDSDDEGLYTQKW